MTQNITFEIDGRSVVAAPGESIIDVADREGIYIPRFCYHHTLSVAANCRMCLVDAGKGKPVAACATPVAEGMKVETQSAKTQSYQESVMTFLLINHPLDCPICDQGGECGLQDYAMAHGLGKTPYSFEKRAVVSEDLGPLIATHMTRCIHCTRCVRFGEEHAGIKELGVMNRGEQAAISTYLDQGVASELSGNMIDLCPVGALTSKPFQYTERSWSLTAAPSIAPHDCVGSEITLHTIKRDEPQAKVVRTVPGGLEQHWISDRDRFSYEGLNHNRLTHPMVLEDGHWKVVSWQQALDVVFHQLSQVIAEYGEQAWGCLLHPSSSMEECYLIQQWARGIGTANIDHRIHWQQAPSHWTVVPKQGDVSWDSARRIWVIGGSPRQAQPMVMHRIRQAIKQGVTLKATRFTQETWHCDIDEDQYIHPSDLLRSVTEDVQALLASEPNETLIVLSSALEGHPDYTAIRQLLAKEKTLSCYVLSTGGNATGAAAMMCLPDGSQDINGKSVSQMLDEPLSAYWLHGIDPLHDLNRGKSYCDLLKDRFVVAVHSHDTPSLRQVANVMLPMAAYAEQSGTTLNYLNQQSTYRAAVMPRGEAKPGWKIYRVLADYWSLSGWDYQDINQVRAALTNILPMALNENVGGGASLSDGLYMVAESHGMVMDELTRQSPALSSLNHTSSVIVMHPNTAKSLMLR